MDVINDKRSDANVTHNIRKRWRNDFFYWGKFDVKQVSKRDVGCLITKFFPSLIAENVYKKIKH